MSRQLKVHLSEIGRVDDVCPYCGQALAKRPSRKTACSYCKQFIFVRTRPYDRKSVLVTEEQANLLQAEWSGFERVSISPHLDPQLMEKHRQRLQEKFKQVPSEQDVAWAYLNSEGLNHAKQRNWGLYRNGRLSMAAVLEKGGSFLKSLRFYFEVSYLDLNGPENGGGSPYSRDFDIKNAFLAPAVIAKTLELIAKLKMEEEQVHQLFKEMAELNYKNLKLPIAPAAAWTKLSSQFYT